MLDIIIIIEMMLIRNRPVMSKQHPSILSSFWHSHDVRTGHGQRDSAEIGRGSELIHLDF